MKGGVLTLLPEAYMRLMLQNYRQDIDVAYDDPCLLCAHGFLALSNEDCIPIRVPMVSALESEATAEALGPRIWSFCKKSRPSADLDAAMLAAAPALRDFGQRVPCAQASLFFTQASSLDPLVGLTVRWTMASAGKTNLPTLDVDTQEPSGAQSSLEDVRA